MKVKEQINKIKQETFENIDQFLTYMVAEYQADSVIAYRTNKMLNDIVVTSDSDQAVHTWEHCCCIKSFILKDKDNKTIIEDISIFCARHKTLETICDIINLPLNSPSIKLPKYPIIDYNDCRLRSLIAIGVGCDVYLNGVPTITPKKIYDYINKLTTKMES